MIFSRLDKRRVWIMDPLDGTAEFIAHNGEFVIMIGLAVDGAPVVGRGVPADQGCSLRGHQGPGRVRRGIRRAPAAARLRRAGSRQVPPGRQPVTPAALVDTMVSEMGLQRERSIGSVGLKIGLIARGQAEFYVHPNPGTKEWDTCAPDIIVL